MGAARRRPRNRADVVFLINGLPIAVAETKKAAKPDGLEEGVQQIRRYHKETPELFTSSQVFEVTQLVDFFYGVTWNTSRKNLFNWKDEAPGDLRDARSRRSSTGRVSCACCATISSSLTRTTC